MARLDNEYFDLSALIDHDDLNIRALAMEYPELTVGEYCDYLAEFARLAPDAVRGLNKFADLRGELGDYRNIDAMITLMEEMGIDKFILDLHSLLSAYGKKGDWRDSSYRAGVVAVSFKEFSDEIIAARKAGREKYAADPDMALGEYIDRLDEDGDYKPLILAVDDSPVILKAVSSVLKDKYKVLTLPKPSRIEEMLGQVTPDLFILDYLMPDMNGMDLVDLIRSYEEHWDTPIIFLTSDGTFESVTAAIALGVRDFILKPFNPDVLRDKVAKAIANRQAR